MELSEIYLDLGQDAFGRMVRGMSIGKLKTYQMYEGFKVRAHLAKVNTESLRKAVPRFWTRISEKDEEFAKELAQALLVSHLDLVTAVLDFQVRSEYGVAEKGRSPILDPHIRKGRGVRQGARTSPAGIASGSGHRRSGLPGHPPRERLFCQEYGPEALFQIGRAHV